MNGRETDGLYERIWEMLPPPAGQWDSSFSIANDAVEFHFDRGQYDDALRWLVRADLALSNAPNPAILGWLGKIRYRQGRLSEALTCFDDAHEVWGMRPFGTLPSESDYYEFYVERSSGRSADE